MSDGRAATFSLTAHGRALFARMATQPGESIAVRFEEFDPPDIDERTRLVGRIRLAEREAQKPFKRRIYAH
ncbi:hypothetical protein CD351_08170 [Erythrobacter sp. KY5]|uniref:hypothetical protein n=1 Tax=Erythrobacter sp. KY5 TaxID=2011159 RepID=UPI000DBF2675|nr:hypothetical protein [Erythrobacter sp. KY5]AWW74399.1 hypothetical protein CD351_08170 [Erythrobacter sp. KY5]